MYSFNRVINNRLKITVLASVLAALIAVAGLNLLSSDTKSSDLVAPGVVAANFLEGSLTKVITTEDCTLSDGTKTTCYRIEVTGSPVDAKIGPFCPESTSSTAEVSGIWLDGEKMYNADGQFIMDLSTIYKDVKWKLYDDSGKVKVTDTKEAFQGAARPDVQDAYKYHCVEGTWEWTETTKPVPTSILVPVTPVLASETSSPRGNLGVTVNGLVISASAPVDAILGAYTIAAFDDCGGHFNPTAGYHLHAYTGCEGIEYESHIDNPNAETKIIGYAMDGVAVFAPLSSKSTIKLDECNGRTTAKDGYHYYAQSAEKNLVVKCLKGLTAVDPLALDEGPGAQGGPAVDTAAAAKILGITEAELTAAFGNKMPPDFATA
ncbi:MAG: YHYH protein, partial [Actinobacteria bacterium]|nr:YHYH protein [Actinomycetota bacterium]